jgi:large subunit ribosomal protein L25
MATIEFTAFPRTSEGRGASRRMRRSGKAPGIVYGGTTPPQPIELDHNALIHALRTEAFHASILTMKVDGASTQVPLHFVNEEVSPAVKTQGAIVSHVMTEIDIACLPKDLPEFIEVDLSALDTAHSMHVSGVKLPPGVSIVSRRTGDPVVATAVVPKAVVETEEAAPVEGEAAAVAGAAPAAEAKPAEPKPEEKGEKGGKKESGKDEKKK